MTIQAHTLLLEARRTRRPLDALPESLRPLTAAAAYAIQNEVLAALGGIGGWKVGASSSTGEPSCSPLPAAGVVRSGHVFEPAAFRLNGLEAEIAFTIAHDLPPRAAPYVEADVLAALDMVHPAIEIVDSRFVDMRAVDPLCALADLANHGALVVGPGRATDLRVDQTRQRAVLEVAGRRIYEGIGGNAAGDVFRLVVWLANHAAARCGGLRAGQVITTGSCSGLTFAQPPSTVRATLDKLGVCEASLR